MELLKKQFLLISSFVFLCDVLSDTGNPKKHGSAVYVLKCVEPIAQIPASGEWIKH